MSDVIAKVPVVEVTLQEDRAQIRRQGSVTLPPGRSRVRIEGVAPVLVDKSLVAQLQVPQGTDTGCRVLGVTARRWRVTEQSQRPEALAALEAQVRAARTTLETTGTRLADLEAEHLQIRGVIDMTIAELSEDAGWGTVDPDRGHATLDALHERLIALGAERCALEAEQHQHKRQLADLQALTVASTSVDAHAAAALDVELENPETAPTTLTLQVDYLVPGALWRPWHRARLVEDDEQHPRVELSCEGCVWQATGEDWTDVTVWFSTERPSLGLSPPKLATDRLHLRRKGAAVEVQTRQQQIHTAGLGTDPTVAADEDLPGIDDGGEAQRLRGMMRTTIPGDGRPYRIPLFELTSPATMTLTCVPELVPAVVLRTEQTNTARHPLLAGPVDLMRHSGLVGRTSTLYVAPGERFELGWGPDNALRVTREVDHLDWERKTLSSWTKRPRRVRIKLSNLEGTGRTIAVKERIAVSEIDKVKVELDAAEPRASADADGFVQWEVHLKGLSRQQLSLRWTMTVHDDVQGL